MSSLGNKYVLAVDFGYPMNPHARSSILDLTEVVRRHYASDPRTIVLAQDFIHDMLARRQFRFPAERLIEVASGQSTTADLKSGGSYHMLQQARAIMLAIERGAYYPGKAVSIELPRSLDGWPRMDATVVAHALHVGRVVKQGKLLNLELTPAEGLPTRLYGEAAQWWCRSRAGWYFREMLGYIPLKLAGQI